MPEASVERRWVIAKELSVLPFPNPMQSEANATTSAIRNSQFAILLLCYGNPLRRDDGVGWVIGERLAEMLREDVADVRVLHQLTPELAEPISRAGAVIFIDAAEPAGRRMNSAFATANPLKRVDDADTSVCFNALPGAGVGFNRCPDEPGAIRWSAIQPGAFTAQPFTHQMDPAGLLAAAWELFGHAPPARLLTVTGADFGFGEGLSPAVENAAVEAVEQIAQIVGSRYWVFNIS